LLFDWRTPIKGAAVEDALLLLLLLFKAGALIAPRRWRGRKDLIAPPGVDRAAGRGGAEAAERGRERATEEKEEATTMASREQRALGFIAEGMVELRLLISF